MVVSQSGTYQTTMRQPIFHRPRQMTRHAQRQKSRITHSISSISKDVDEYQYSIQIIITRIPRINSTYNLRLTCRNPCYHTNIRYSKRIAATRNNKTTKTPGTQRPNTKASRCEAKHLYGGSTNPKQRPLAAQVQFETRREQEDC